MNNSQLTIPLETRPATQPEPPQERRVRVAIKDVDHYAKWCGETLQGAVGRVARVKENSCCGTHGWGPAWLVEFDTPIPSWWEGGEPVTAFWFPPDDLEVLA